jgi:hypothetical protein
MRKKWFGNKAIAAHLAQKGLAGATKGSDRLAS